MIMAKKFRTVLIPLITLLFIVICENIVNKIIPSESNHFLFIISLFFFIVKLFLIFRAASGLIKNDLIIPLPERLDNKKDYRWVPALMIIGYFLIVIFSQIFFNDYKYLWRYMGVPAYHDGLFHDLKVITYGMDCLRNGIEPLYNGPCYPGFTFNYPATWYIFKYTGIGSQHAIITALTLILLFYVTCYYLIGKSGLAKSVFYGIVLLSPPFMLAIERCNNDMLIFMLLFLALSLLQTKSWKKHFAYIFILISTILKMHPLFSFIVAIKEKPKITAIIYILSAVILFAVAAVYFPSYLQSARVTPRPYEWFSFGSNVLGFYFFQNSLGIKEIRYKIMIISFAFALLLMLIMIFRARKIKYTTPDEGFRIDAFRLGAALYIGNFIIGNNYDYRMIFLLFCLPQLLTWATSAGSLKKLSVICIANLLILFHYTSILRHAFTAEWIMTSKAIFYWGVFVILFMLLLHSLPNNKITRLLLRPSSPVIQ